MTAFLCVGNILLRILFTALEKALLLPRWQRMDHQSSLSMHYCVIPDWMLTQYGRYPATVSPSAAFVILDVGPSIAHGFASCMKDVSSCNLQQQEMVAWYGMVSGSGQCLPSTDCFVCFDTACLLALKANGCYS